MESISSSKRRRCLRAIVRSALEGVFLALSVAAVLGRVLAPDLRSFAWAGAGLAWAASTAGVGFLIFSRTMRPEAFMKAFGAGVALRAAVLLGMMGALRDESWAAQGAAVLPYIGTLFVLLLTEYRHLNRI